MGRTRYGVREEIRETAEGFYRALSQRNLRAMSGLWAHEPYAAVAGRSGQLHQGWNEVYGYWENRFRQLGDAKVSVRLVNMTHRAVGDVAWMSGTERRTVTENDHLRQEDLRMTCVLERQGSSWQIVSYHVSAPTQPVESLANAS